MDALQTLLLEGGPNAITYSALAERSGVGRATLYRHWPSLDALLQELVAKKAAAAQVATVGDVATDLRNALNEMRRNLASADRRVALLTMIERAGWDDSARALLNTMEQLLPVRLALNTAVKGGQLPGELDVEVATSLLIGPLLHRGLMSQRRLTARFTDTVVDAFLATYAADSTTP